MGGLPHEMGRVGEMRNEYAQHGRMSRAKAKPDPGRLSRSIIIADGAGVTDDADIPPSHLASDLSRVERSMMISIFLCGDDVFHLSIFHVARCSASQF